MQPADTTQIPEPGAEAHAATLPLVEVAVMAPAPGPYHYLAPPELRDRLTAGARVMVPLSGQRLVEGVVLHLLEGAEAGAAQREHQQAGRRLRPIGPLIDGPAVPPDLLALARFMADYYLAPLGEALRLLLPPAEQASVEELLRLTPAGAACAEELSGALWSEATSALGALDRAVVLALASRHGREVSLKRLGKLAPLEPEEPKTSEVRHAVARLCQLGLVERSDEVQAGSTPKREVVASPHLGDLTTAQEKVLSRSQPRAALFERLRTLGPTPLPRLRAEFPSAPALLKALHAAGLCTLDEREISDEAIADPEEPGFGAGKTPPPLTPEQSVAMAALQQALDGSLAAGGADRARGYHGFLLHGVTGSGKTELYLRLIHAAIERGRTALVLVPEIALTPQLASRFRARFGRDIAVLHSALTPRQRADAWRRILRGEVRIALGPRSALFAPLSRLGVVIVDEEHDSSFKQQDGVRYHGRDVALLRAQQAGAIAVLGSATPSLESLDLARRGKLTLLRLHRRATGAPMPSIEVVDLKRHKIGKDDALLSAPLRTALEDTLAAGEQAILFLNRRGYATFLLCAACGLHLSCPRCAVTLTFHKAKDRLSCHYCGHSAPVPETCPSCSSPAVQRLGLGTEKLEEQVAARFPAARLGRLDRDTAGPGALTRVLGAMHRHELDILIGTQMLAKGHDFPGVTLVGVVLADTGMGLPDFRASERTFQLLSQVAGRAGRAERAGRVLIQTYNPDHPAVLAAAAHDFDGFAEQELGARRVLHYPPMVRLGLLRIDGEDAYEVSHGAETVAAAARAALASPAASGAEVLGPAEAPLSKLKDRTRWQVLVRAPTRAGLHAVLRAALRTRLASALRLHADVDPVSTL